MRINKLIDAAEFLMKASLLAGGPKEWNGTPAAKSSTRRFNRRISRLSVLLDPVEQQRAFGSMCKEKPRFFELPLPRSIWHHAGLGIQWKGHWGKLPYGHRKPSTLIGGERSDWIVVPCIVDCPADHIKLRLVVREGLACTLKP